MDAHIYPKGCAFNRLEDIKDKHVTVMGLGLNGGGEASVKFFLKHGAYVTVTDMKTADELRPTIESISADSTIDKSRLTYVLGQHRIEDFSEADCVIKNPGVRFEGNQYLAAAKAVETDISIFLHFTKSPIIAVTGSKGKSSTVSSIDYGLRQAGFTSFLGGNITVSPLTFLHETSGLTPVVLELSSWQLRDLRGRGCLKPKIAVITKIVPDHQNWYHSMDKYIQDKMLIFENQTAEDFTILDFDEDNYSTDSETPDPEIHKWGDFFAKATKGTVLRYSKNPLPKNVFGVWQKINRYGLTEGYETLPFNLRTVKAQKHFEESQQIMGKLSVPGAHMKTNVLNACLCLRLMGVAPEQTMQILGQWKGIPHRLELFLRAKYNKMHLAFYNDSAATVPQAVCEAIKAFDRPIILITGGTDKQLDFTPLANTLEGKDGTKNLPKEIFALEGSGTDKLLDLTDTKKVHINGPYESIKRLITVLKSHLDHGGTQFYGISTEDTPLVIVFSPGATSFGMFKNEFDRGNTFKGVVKEFFI